jgi:hypothetical protein
MKYYLTDVFRQVALNPHDWHQAIGNFMHLFIIDSDFDVSLVQQEPEFYDNIPIKHYIFAACFVHYWCDVMLKAIPEWVFKSKYKYDKPVYYPGPVALLNRDTPYQFKEHNVYMLSKEVLVV